MTAGKKTTRSAGKKGLRVTWNVPADFPTAYATHLLVQHTKDDFTITFFDIRPPVVMGTPEDKARQLEALGEVVAVPQARIVVAATRMHEFVQVMEDNLKTYRLTVHRESPNSEGEE